MSEPVVYIKGYKVDRDKLKATYGSRENDPKNTRFLAIWEKFPSDFKYLGSEKESDGGHCSGLCPRPYHRLLTHTRKFLLRVSESVFEGGKQVHNSY